MMRIRPTRAAIAAALALTLAALAPVPAAHAQTTEADAVVVYLVRHGETEPDGTRDPALSAQGRARAERLARMLAGAGLTAIHTTDYRRTRGTAAPVAAATGLAPRSYDPADLPGLAARLAEEGGTHLVVGHSNTTPALARALGGDPAGPIAEDEHGRVYQLTIRPDRTGGAAVHTALLGYPGGFLADPPGTRPAAARADVASVDAIVAALYDAISGPTGEPRDWERMRSLFLPSARLIPTQRAPDGSVRYRALTVEEYIRGSGPMIESMGFREHEIARTQERFGDVVHAFSTYEGFREGDTEPYLRGINSIQMIHDGQRWWITSVAWAPEAEGLMVPPEYMP